jgi:hypothetical protein
MLGSVHRVKQVLNGDQSQKTLQQNEANSDFILSVTKFLLII